MRNRFLTISLIVFTISIICSPISAQTKVSGLVFGDYYFVASNHNQTLENLNGFWLRRVYVTFDHQFEEKSLSARVRFEANSPGDFKSTTKIEPFVKHLYLQWKAHDNHTLLFGLSGPPTYGVVEEVWGYRHVEKTPLDLYSFAPSSDFGVAIKGNLASKWKYHGMIANGSGTSAETNSDKKAMASFGYSPTKTILVEGYADTENRSGNENRQTYQIFAGFKNNKERLGLLMARINRNTPVLEDSFDLISAFAVRKISKTVSVFARYDRMFDPNPSGEKTAYLPFDSKSKSNFVLAGADFHVAKNLSLIPNIEYVTYDGIKPAPKSDLISRFTLYFTF